MKLNLIVCDGLMLVKHLRLVARLTCVVLLDELYIIAEAASAVGTGGPDSHNGDSGRC